MRIERSRNQNGTIAPVALNYLGEIPEAFRFLNQHAHRPPLGIYNVSFQLLMSEFKKVLNEYDKTKTFIAENTSELPKGDDYYDSLLKAQKDLLLSIQAHVDDCYAVLASLVNPAKLNSKVSKIRFTDRWLDAVAFPTIRQFKDAISDYREGYLAPLVNGLKHRQNRLRGMFFHSSREVRLGYYLEAPDSNGVLGPALDLHKDGNSALSFAKDILFNLYYVYHLSEVLTEAVRVALQHYHSFFLSLPKANIEDHKWVDIVRMASNIRPLVFPDEIDKPYPYLSFSETDGDASLVIIYPVTLIPLSFPHGMKIHGTTMGDGVTRSFKIPYLKASRYGGIR